MTPDEQTAFRLRLEENRAWLELREVLPDLQRISCEGPRNTEDLALVRQLFHTTMAKLHLDSADRIAQSFIDREFESNETQT